MSSVTRRRIEPADIRARNPIKDHFTISFPFLIRSSSQSETVIINAPYTIAHTASKPKKPHIALVQARSLFLTQLSIRPSPGFTKSVPDKHPSNSLAIEPPQ